jgi:hypothetical protein
VTPNPELQGLHEIVFADPVSWMPKTEGWYVLLSLVLIALAWWGYGLVRRYMANRYRRLALAELSAIEQELRHPQRRTSALEGIPVLIKRTALSAFPREEVAELCGQKWLAFLDKTMGGKDFTEGPGRLLGELAYVPASRFEQLSEQGVADLLQLARCWIKRHAVILT